MDPIEIKYDSMEAVPEAVRGLYTEQNGAAVLTGVNGIKTQQDVANVQEALRKEREDHAETRNAYKPWSGLDYAEVMSKLDRIKELEAAGAGKLDEAKLEELVAGRIEQKTGPLSRQIQSLTEERDGAISERDALRNQMLGRDRNDVVRAAATEMKVVSSAIPDIEMVAANYLELDETSGQFIVRADAQGVTPGVDVKQFMKEMQKMRPHWWPASEGSGANGAGAKFNGGNNPFSKAHWNVTEQGRVYREQGAEIAASMAKAAGTTIGGSRPAT